MPAVADLVARGARRRAPAGSSSASCSSSEPTRPIALEPGGTARVVFAVLDVARRSVAAGLVHPHLEAADGRWHALWGATLDEHVVDELDAIAHAAPAAAADAFDGDTRRIRPRPLRLRGRRARAPRPARRGRHASRRLARPRGRRGAVPRRPRRADAGASGRRAATPRSSGGSPHGSTAGSHAARARRGTSGSASTRRTPRDAGIAPPVVLELWLEAADDPTLALPASLLESGADEVFAFLRDSDPRRALERRLETIEPILADAGIALEGDPPTHVELDAEQVRAFLRDAMPRLEELGVPLRLPREWVSSSSRVRVNLVATGSPAVSSGLLTRDAIASFDWRLAIGDVELTRGGAAGARRGEGAADPAARQVARAPRDRGRACASLPRGPRALRRRRRARPRRLRPRDGRGRRRARRGQARRDPRRPPRGRGRAPFQPLPTPAGMRHDLFPFQERGHGWLRLLGDLRVGGILADDMGLGKTVQAIATFVSEREDADDDVGPTLVVSPMSVTQQWAREIARFAPGLRVHLHHGPCSPRGRRVRRDRRAERRRRHVVRRRDARRRAAVARRRGTGCCSTRRRTRRTRGRSGTARCAGSRGGGRSRSRARRSRTGSASSGRSWTSSTPGLLGSREAFERTFARPIEIRRDAQALERLRSLVGPFVLRRAKDAPEVDLELPPITIDEGAVPPDRRAGEPLPRHGRPLDAADRAPREPFDRRGAVLAMLGQLKQVCNHPELVVPDAAGRSTGAPASSSGSSSCSRPCRPTTRRSSSPSTRASTGSRRTSRERLDRSVGFFHGGLSARARDELVARFESGSEPVGARRLAPRGGRGPQPPRRESRPPLRPVVEPRGRAAGDRPRPPARPAQAGLRVEPRLHRDARGADRRAARLEARARRRR